MANVSFFSICFALGVLLCSVQAAEKQCKATAYYHKKVAYNSGIYFQHGEKYHEAIYGNFWDGVNETGTKNIGLKRFTYGYDKDMVGYLWGNALEYGYVGGGKGFVLGFQAAMGSLAGLLTPETEKAFTASYKGEEKGTWNQTSGFPLISSPNGASAAVAMDTVLNRTVADQQQSKNVTDDDDVPPVAAVALAAVGAAMPQQQTRSLSFESENSVQWAKRGDDNSSADATDEDCDEDESDEKKDDGSGDDDEDCEEDDDDDGRFKHGPETCAVYRAPWKSAKPVYFFGQCDNCDKKTGFNENGHGSFQSCSLIYYGKEYFGKPEQTDDRYTCVVDFDC